MDDRRMEGMDGWNRERERERERERDTEGMDETEGVTGGGSPGMNGTIAFAKGSNLCGIATSALYAVHKPARAAPPQPDREPA